MPASHTVDHIVCPHIRILKGDTDFFDEVDEKKETSVRSEANTGRVDRAERDVSRRQKIVGSWGESSADRKDALDTRTVQEGDDIGDSL
jgi:hypothetical protein